MKKLAVAAGIVLMAGCAQPPHLIKPAPTSDVAYAARSCQELGVKLKKTYVELAERSQVQLSDEATDENGARIATLKGEQNTILDMMARKNCPAGG
ncbi:MAG: hypothetical protein AB7F09_06625 [Parvibaculaceae bacterium]